MLTQIGLHSVATFDGILSPKVPIVKLVDASVETILETANKVGPNVPVIVRWWEKNQGMQNPVQAAEAWFNKHVADMILLTAKSSQIAFEGFNEIHLVEPFIAHETRRLELMHGEGLPGVYINSSRGTYEPDEWKKWSGFFDKLWPNEKIGIHEYGSGYFEQDYPHLIGRAWDFKDIGTTLKDVPLVVTEFGALADYADLGWKVCLNGNREKYMEYIRRCDEYYRSKGVLVCLFTGGQCGNDWKTHCINELWQEVYDSMAEPLVTPVPVPDIFYLLLGPRAAECHSGWDSDDHLAHKEHIAFDVAGFQHWPVYAIDDGWVDFITYEDANNLRGRGHCLGVVHPDIKIGPHDVLEVSPCHLAEKPFVKEGEQVKRGQLLGYTGYSGHVIPAGPLGEHVHLVCYSVKNNPSAYPYTFIRPESLRIKVV